jgi:hemoglobin
MPTPDTMFERYGGFAFVTRFVLSFYDRVLASAGLARFFADTDMARLVEHQAKFISSVMGGPASYSDAKLREAHAHLQIDDRAFDEMIGLLRVTWRISRSPMPTSKRSSPTWTRAGGTLSMASSE